MHSRRRTMEHGELERIITATELKQNLGKYLSAVMENNEVVITKNGQRAVRLSPYINEYERYSMIQEEANQYDFGDLTISYEEFLEISEKSEQRMEFIDGKIILLSSPNSFHQEILGNLYASLRQYFKGKKCKVYLAPFDVTLYKIKLKTPDVVQPDLLVACDTAEKMNEEGRYSGVPTLVVEILSPSTRSKDMIDKMNTYMRSGVREYWIVDPKKKTILQYGFQDYELDVYESYCDTSNFMSYSFEDLAVSLEEVFYE